MIAVLQRVKQAQVSVDDKVISTIDQGLLILLGVGHDDNMEDVTWLTKKVVNMRIFADENGKMNRSIIDVGGALLVVSQFTLHASIKKGNRPSFIRSALPDKAQELYNNTIQIFENLLSKPIASGEFATYMQVSLINDGPVTILIDTKNRI